MSRQLLCRMAAPVFAVLATFAAAGCASPTGTAEVVQESWSYRGTQRLPTVLQLQGDLVITSRNGDRFEGSLTLLRGEPGGQVERVTGLVRGRRQQDRLDFDATLAGATVRHYGAMLGDSVAGSWLDDSGNGASLVSGSFVMQAVP